MHDYAHLELLCKFVDCLKGLAKILGPWPTVVFAALILSFAGLCAHDTFVIVEILIRAAFAAFFVWVGRWSWRTGEFCTAWVE